MGQFLGRIAIGEARDWLDAHRDGIDAAAASDRCSLAAALAARDAMHQRVLLQLGRLLPGRRAGKPGLILRPGHRLRRLRGARDTAADAAALTVAARDAMHQ